MDKHKRLEEWDSIQEELRKKLDWNFHPEDFAEDGIMLTMDVQYAGNMAFAAADCAALNGDCVGIFLEKFTVKTDYHSGYFAFREGPILEALVQKVRLIHPVSCLTVDGHGRTHPRNMGLACWIGIRCDLPSIGFAKRPLLRHTQFPESHKDAVLAIREGDEILGWIWRSRENKKPVYVSPGHRMDAETALSLLRKQAGPYRQIESIRRADQYARAFARGEVESGYYPYSPSNCRI